MEDSEHDADRAVLGQFEADLPHRSLDEALVLLDIARAEEAGEFELEQATFLRFPLVIPAVHKFVKLFVKKVIEDPASEAEMMTAAALMNRLGNVLGNLEGQQLHQQALADLERCLAERATVLNFPKSSYGDLLRRMRNPRIFL